MTNYVSDAKQKVYFIGLRYAWYDWWEFCLLKEANCCSRSTCKK